MAGVREQDWGQLVQRSPPTNHDNRNDRNNRPRQTLNAATNSVQKKLQVKSDFWSELESRVGSGGNQDDTRRRGAGARPHRPRRPLRAGGAEATTATEAWQDDVSPHAAAGPEIDDAISNLIQSPETGVIRQPDAFEQRRKPRKEKVQTSKPKAKPKLRRRDTEFEMDEDDDYDEDMELERRRRKDEKKRRKEEEAAAAAAAAQSPTPILLPQLITVGNLGMALRVKPHIFLRQLAVLGFEDISLESVMTGETAALIAQEYGYDPSVDSGAEVDLKSRPVPDDPSTLPQRPPIVTIMGHVDHGKTTMLDWLRKSSVAAQEHGGITQHIGAFSVRLSGGKQITFLDTPGHAAFLTMRQRGAHVTDIVILVVAADDSVKPQTLEALKHARSAKVPIIVAINKVDKDEARVDQVKGDLARHGVEIEDYGGDVQVVCVSGKTGQGMADLEENILTLTEILDVRAETDGMAEGWVLESSVKPVGRSASVLVKRGTLRRGDIVAAGTTWAKIRSMRSEAGTEVDEASPGTPVEILGWRELPDAGDEVLQAPTETRVKEAIGYRQELKEREKAASDVEAQERREKERAALAEAAAAASVAAAAAGSSADSAANGTGTAEAAGDLGPIKVNFTVKGDVMGSVEAVCAAIMEIGNNEVRPQVLRSAPGAVSEFDIEHAAATQSAVINFNTPLTGAIKRLAEEAGVTILDHTVIYHLIDDVKDRLSAQLAPTVSSKVLGEAEVLQVFPINMHGRVFKNIAGCRVRNGPMTRGAMYRVYRGGEKGEKVFEGECHLPACTSYFSAM